MGKYKKVLRLLLKILFHVLFLNGKTLLCSDTNQFRGTSYIRKKKGRMGPVCKGDSLVKEQNLPGRKKGEKEGGKKKGAHAYFLSLSTHSRRTSARAFLGRRHSLQQHFGRRLRGLQASSRTETGLKSCLAWSWGR